MKIPTVQTHRCSEKIHWNKEAVRNEEKGIKRWLDEKEGQKVRKNRRGQKKGWNERMDSGNVRGVEAFVLRSKAVVSIKAE